MNTEQSMAVADTIRDQIGNRGLVMMGSRNLLGSASGLQFKIGRNALKVTHVRITLESSDTYTVEFIRVGRAPRFTITEISRQELVFVDSLRAVLETGTGMYLSL